VQVSPEQAVDEMSAVFVAAWDPAYPVLWPDVAGAVPAGGPWARVTVQHFDGGQSSLANDVGAKKHTAKGTLTVQVFAPVGNGKVTGYQLAYVVLQAYRNARGSVWYRNQRMREAGNSGAHEQTNVLIDFTYDD
jgi:hypothetical protein